MWKVALKKIFFLFGRFLNTLIVLSCSIIQDTLYVQSQQYFNRVPLFLVKVFKDLNFEMHSCGITHKVVTVHPRLDFEEIISYFKNMEIGNKACVLQEHLSAMGPTVIGKRMFSQELVVQAFQYFAGAFTIGSESIINYSPQKH